MVATRSQKKKGDDGGLQAASLSASDIASSSTPLDGLPVLESSTSAAADDDVKLCLHFRAGRTLREATTVVSADDDEYNDEHKPRWLRHIDEEERNSWSYRYIDEEGEIETLSGPDALKVKELFMKYYDATPAWADIAPEDLLRLQFPGFFVDRFDSFLRMNEVSLSDRLSVLKFISAARHNSTTSKARKLAPDSMYDGTSSTSTNPGGSVPKPNSKGRGRREATTMASPDDAPNPGGSAAMQKDMRKPSAKKVRMLGPNSAEEPSSYVVAGKSSTSTNLGSSANMQDMPASVQKRNSTNYKALTRFQTGFVLEAKRTGVVASSSNDLLRIPKNAAEKAKNKKSKTVSQYSKFDHNVDWESPSIQLLVEHELPRTLIMLKTNLPCIPLEDGRPMLTVIVEYLFNDETVLKIRLGFGPNITQRHLKTVLPAFLRNYVRGNYLINNKDLMAYNLDHLVDRIASLDYNECRKHVESLQSSLPSKSVGMTSSTSLNEDDQEDSASSKPVKSSSPFPSSLNGVKSSTSVGGQVRFGDTNENEKENQDLQVALDIPADGASPKTSDGNHISKSSNLEERLVAATESQQELNRSFHSKFDLQKERSDLQQKEIDLHQREIDLLKRETEQQKQHNELQDKRSEEQVKFNSLINSKHDHLRSDLDQHIADTDRKFRDQSQNIQRTIERSVESTVDRRLRRAFEQLSRSAPDVYAGIYSDVPSTPERVGYDEDEEEEAEQVDGEDYIDEDEDEDVSRRALFSRTDSQLLRVEEVEEDDEEEADEEEGAALEEDGKLPAVATPARARVHQEGDDEGGDDDDNYVVEEDGFVTPARPRAPAPAPAPAPAEDSWFLPSRDETRELAERTTASIQQEFRGLSERVNATPSSAKKRSSAAAGLPEDEDEMNGTAKKKRTGPFANVNLDGTGSSVPALPMAGSATFSFPPAACNTISFGSFSEGDGGLLTGTQEGNNAGTADVAMKAKETPSSQGHSTTKKMVKAAAKVVVIGVAAVNGEAVASAVASAAASAVASASAAAGLGAASSSNAPVDTNTFGTSGGLDGEGATSSSWPMDWMNTRMGGSNQDGDGEGATASTLLSTFGGWTTRNALTQPEEATGGSDEDHNDEGATASKLLSDFAMFDQTTPTQAEEATGGSD